MQWKSLGSNSLDTYGVRVIFSSLKILDEEHQGTPETATVPEIFLSYIFSLDLV